MEERYFKNENPLYHVPAKMEKERVFDVTDPKWAHPIIEDGWKVPDGTSLLYDPSVPMEEKIKQAKELTDSLIALFGGPKDDSVEITEYTAPGCSEEPDVSVNIKVYRPAGLKKKKARCIFYCLGGALVMREPDMFPIQQLCTRHNCVVVVPLYRRSWEAQYPAAINDLHAAYKWMVENAETIRINPDNVVLHGCSSGGHLAMSIAFRLKRYGYSPKGIVAVEPQTDERENDLLSHKIYTSDWDAGCQRMALGQWLGYDFGSAQIGPEALANHATVEECIGYPPVFIHTLELDPDRDNCREFYGKVLEAKSFAEFHCWGGAKHAGSQFAGGCSGGDENEYSKRVNLIINNNIEDCFSYDLRRPWVVEEFNK